MIQYLSRDKRVVDHVVVFHAAEAAVSHTVVHLILHQVALEERADLPNGAVEVLTHTNNKRMIPNFFRIVYSLFNKSALD